MYDARCYQGAFILSQFFCAPPLAIVALPQSSEALAKITAIELGCGGAALVGLVLAALGVGQVVATDKEADLLELAEHNATLNNLHRLDSILSTHAIHETPFCIHLS